MTLFFLYSLFRQKMTTPYVLVNVLFMKMSCIEKEGFNL